MKNDKNKNSDKNNTDYNNPACNNKKVEPTLDYFPINTKSCDFCGATPANTKFGNWLVCDNCRDKL